MRRFFELFLLALIVLSAIVLLQGFFGLGRPGFPTATPRPTQTPSPIPIPTQVPVEWDFGDAPDPQFITVMRSNGLRIVDPFQYWLGSLDAPGASLERNANVIDLDAQDDGLIGIQDSPGWVTLTFRVVRSEQAPQGGSIPPMYFNLWADLNNNGVWEGFLFNRLCPTPIPNPSVDIPWVPRNCPYGEWIVQNMGFWLNPGGNLIFSFNIDHLLGVREHWLRAALTNRPLPSWEPIGQYQLGEVEDYHLVPPYVLAPTAGSLIEGAPVNATPTSTTTPTPRPEGGYVIPVGGGYTVIVQVPKKVTFGEDFQVVVKATDSDGNPAPEGTEVAVSLGNDPSASKATHAHGRLNEKGQVTLMLGVHWPKGSTEALWLSWDGGAPVQVDVINVVAP